MHNEEGGSQLKLTQNNTGVGNSIKGNKRYSSNISHVPKVK